MDMKYQHCLRWGGGEGGWGRAGRVLILSGVQCGCYTVRNMLTVTHFTLQHLTFLMCLFQMNAMIFDYMGVLIIMSVYQWMYSKG